MYACNCDFLASNGVPLSHSNVWQIPPEISAYTLILCLLCAEASELRWKIFTPPLYLPHMPHIVVQLIVLGVLSVPPHTMCYQFPPISCST